LSHGRETDKRLEQLLELTAMDRNEMDRNDGLPVVLQMPVGEGMRGAGERGSGVATATASDT
jgi:hypothetical protein